MQNCIEFNQAISIFLAEIQKMFLKKIIQSVHSKHCDIIQNHFNISFIQLYCLIFKISLSNLVKFYIDYKIHYEDFQCICPRFIFKYRFLIRDKRLDYIGLEFLKSFEECEIHSQLTVQTSINFVKLNGKRESLIFYEFITRVNFQYSLVQFFDYNLIIIIENLNLNNI